MEHKKKFIMITLFYSCFRLSNLYLFSISHFYIQYYHFFLHILFDREQICRVANQKKCDTLGLAELGTMCKPNSCAIVQDNGLSAAFTIAHELGHV
jgi:hypothetical protein